LRARFAFVLTPSNGKPVVGVEEVRGNTQASEESKKTVEVKTDPPPIFFSTRPAILLTVQGDPVLGPIKGLQLKFVVNANWDLFFVPRGSRYYLLVDKVWLTTDSLSGSWTAAEKLPAELRKLPSGENWDHVQKAVAAWVPGNSKAPKVFYAAEPAELIAFAGEPVYKKIAGTELSYATNTDSRVAGAAAGAALVWSTRYYYPPYIFPGPVPVYRPYYATYGVAATYYPYNGVYAVGGYAYGPYAQNLKQRETHRSQGPGGERQFRGSRERGQRRE